MLMSAYLCEFCKERIAENDIHSAGATSDDGRACGRCFRAREVREVIDTDDGSGERADEQERQLNERMGVSGPVDGPWIVDEINTPNGVGYFVNHIWEDEDSEPGSAHTDEVCEVCMDYKGTRSLDTANLIAAAPDMRIALEVAKLAFEQLGHSRHDSTQCGVALAMVLNAVAKAEGRQPCP